MGLDMYLRAKKHVSGYDFCPADEKAKYGELLAASGLTSDDIDKSTPSLDISITVAYWRKANQIHKWFVDNCQGGIDECQDSYVGREQLEELLALCKKVMENKDKAAELLPACAGFFFGDTEITDWYFDDIKLTIEQLERILGSERLKSFDFEYQSSW